MDHLAHRRVIVAVVGPEGPLPSSGPTRTTTTHPHRPEHRMTLVRRPSSRAGGRDARSESGAVAAEAAVVLPTLVLLTVALAWLVSLGVAQVRVVDAARETARAAARSESDAQAIGLGRRVAPDGATVRVSRGADEVVVRVSAPVRGPGGVLGWLGPAVVSSRAVAAQEPTW